MKLKKFSPVIVLVMLLMLLAGCGQKTKLNEAHKVEGLFMNSPKLASK